MLDLNRDGWLDLTTVYPVDKTGLTPNETTACLSGALFDGTRFEGCDRVQVLPIRVRYRTPRRGRDAPHAWNAASGRARRDSQEERGGASSLD